jgi:hypothetical protein
MVSYLISIGTTVVRLLRGRHRQQPGSGVYTAS